MNILSSEDRYVLMGREVTVEVALGHYRNGWALGYEVGGLGRILVVWARTSGDYEASWVWPDQVLQTTGDHILDKLRDHNYTGADQAAFERIYLAAIAVADEPDPLARAAQNARPKLERNLTPTLEEVRTACGIIALIIGIFVFVAVFY